MKKTKIPAAAAEFPPWIDLPSDVMLNILERLSVVDILGSAQNVCATWWNLCKDPALWRVVNIGNPDVPKLSRGKLTNMYRDAVDRSQGQLIDLTVAYFGHDKFLDEIILRSKHLRRLTVACCNWITKTALVKAIERVPELEELHLVLPYYIRHVDIEAIGKSCPMLKSFTLNHISKFRFPNNKAAVAIARSMPNLCSLRILGNNLNNKGLQFILDGCLHLESLDLRLCFALAGELGIRCCEQIKYLRRPSDSIDAREFFYKSWVEALLRSSV